MRALRLLFEPQQDNDGVIASAHGYIRTTEEDDAPWFHRLHGLPEPRCALLDQKREPLMPTLSEIRETLASREASRSLFFTVEDSGGGIAGFVALRGLNQESGHCEVVPMFLEEEAARTPLAGWALDYVLGRAFDVMRLRKVTAQALCREIALRALLEGREFRFDGAQRQAVHARGAWFDVQALSRPNPAFQCEAAPCL